MVRSGVAQRAVDAVMTVNTRLLVQLNRRSGDAWLLCCDAQTCGTVQGNLGLVKGVRTRVAQRGGGRSHDGGHQAVGLAERRVGDVQALDRDAIERGVIQHDHRVRVEREPLERQHAVVGLHHHVARLVLVWEHAARIHIIRCPSLCWGDATIPYLPYPALT